MFVVSFNFIWKLYTSPKTFYEKQEKNKQIQSFAKQIRDAPILLKKATEKSFQYKISLDSAIKLDAMKMSGYIKY